MKVSTQFTSTRLSHPRRLPKAHRSAVFRVSAVNVEQLRGAKAKCEQLCIESQCQPIMIRLGWHDAGTFNVHDGTGGATGTIRFREEINAAPNRGLQSALDLLKPIKEEFPEVSWADLLQMCSAAAVKTAGGPDIPMRYGRRDLSEEEQGDTSGLPAGNAPFPTGDGPAGHLRSVFYRMGLEDKDIVALSGAHTLGRAFKNRSGVTDKEKTKYTEKGPGTVGGVSWTPEWLKFDNSYFKEVKEQMDPDLLVLQTDDCLFKDPGFAPHANKYHDDNEAFLREYSDSLIKLSELGARWESGAPVTI